MTRIMIVGSDKVYAIENYYRRYLGEFGAEVFLFTAQNYFYDYYNKSVFNKLLYNSSLSGIIAKINTSFKEAVGHFRPDIIWVFKGMEIEPSSLNWAKGRGIMLANYNPDNPFIFSGRGSGNKNITDSISLYDLHFTYNLDVQERLEKCYKARTVFLPFGFDLDEHSFQVCAGQSEILRVCFAGNPDKGRSEVLERMARAGIKIDVFGNNWEQFIKNPSIKINPAIYGQEFWKVLRRYRVQLNLMRVHNADSHNMRSFEVPGVGGIMLAPNTREHRSFFKNGIEVFLFSDSGDLVELAESILELSVSEAEIIRYRAREHSIQAGYSYKDRTKAVFEVFNQLRS